jgi:DnaJ family protein C protein 2
LAKAVKKYPPGGASRWEQISLFVNNLCKREHKRTKEECIEKYNQIARGNKGGSAPTSTSENGPTNGVTSSATTTDSWTTEQDQNLQDALATYPASMDKNERWTSIAKSVPGKTKKQCVQRFKAIREALLKKETR